MSPRPAPLASVEETASAIRAGDRAALARGITLLESTLPEHQVAAQQLLDRLLPSTGAAHRVAVTGPPGAGKSTLIEALGLHLVGAGRRVAVLAIDPSSQLSGGSILGDKTRMEGLARSTLAFIRPSPSGAALGGVARRTREAMLLCEAAGYEVVLVETVGTGQSEAQAAGMVDTFLVVHIGGAGDELQGIKRGVLELADVLAVNKADGALEPGARRAAAELKAAMAILRPRDPEWQPPVLTVSARTGAGIPELWERLAEHRETLARASALERRRRAQRVDWLWDLVDDLLRVELRRHPAVQRILESTEAEVEQGRLAPGLAARRIVEAFAPPPTEESP